MQAPYICRRCALRAGWRMDRNHFQIVEVCCVCDARAACIDTEELGNDFE
jgi:hypothetical protein